MERDFFDPTPEKQIVLLINRAMLRKAEKLIESCEHCNRDVEIPFDNILDHLNRFRSQRDGLSFGKAGEVSKLPPRYSGEDTH